MFSVTQWCIFTKNSWAKPIYSTNEQILNNLFFELFQNFLDIEKISDNSLYVLIKVHHLGMKVISIPSLYKLRTFLSGLDRNVLVINPSLKIYNLSYIVNIFLKILETKSHTYGMCSSPNSGMSVSIINTKLTIFTFFERHFYRCTSTNSSINRSSYTTIFLRA